MEKFAELFEEATQKIAECNYTMHAIANYTQSLLGDEFEITRTEATLKSSASFVVKCNKHIDADENEGIDRKLELHSLKVGFVLSNPDFTLHYDLKKDTVFTNGSDTLAEKTQKAVFEFLKAINDMNTIQKLAQLAQDPAKAPQLVL